MVQNLRLNPVAQRKECYDLALSSNIKSMCFKAKILITYSSNRYTLSVYACKGPLV